MMEIIPAKDTDESVGAFANCFVKESSIDEAVITARKYIEEQNWIVKNIEETAEVNREEYVNDIESLEAYDNANKYGVSAVFYTWSEEDSD
jgi:hypothetical protein